MNENIIKSMVYEAATKRGAAVSASWLSKQLNIPRNEVNNALHTLTKEQKLKRVRGKLYRSTDLEKTEKDRKLIRGAEITGTIQKHPDGYAFFIPDKGKIDLFVPKSWLAGALNGDRVTARKTKYRGKIEAHVTGILERGITTIVGRIEHRKNTVIIIPFHRRFDCYVYVYGSTGRYSDDDIVECRITKYPDVSSRCEGEIVRRLGHIDDKGIENLIVMSKYGLSRAFDAHVEAEAAKVAYDLPAKGQNKGRHDLRDIYTVTIDGETARDFDDAISITEENGRISLYVHIADVSHYVKKETNLDKEAYRRGTSVYFPEYAIPMLPEVLSNGVCSLRSGEDRFAVTVRIDYDKNANRINNRFYRSIINSDRRLTYSYVNDILSGKEKEGDEKLNYLATKAIFLMESIQKRRKGAGYLDFDLPEVLFILDEDGFITDIKPDERGQSERIIEQFMIEANETVAERLSAIAPTGIYRIHGDPDRIKLDKWIKEARKMGVRISRLPETISPEVVQGWFNMIENHHFSHLLKSTLVRSMQRAEYSSENKGHFGLASDSYTHFTSPIRRYPDLIAHRLLKRYEFNEEGQFTPEELEEWARYGSKTERLADDAEREIHLYKKLHYLKANPDRVYSAFISRITSNGIFIFLTEFLMTGYIDVTALPPKGHYNFNPEEGSVYNRRAGIILKLGEEIDVKWLTNDMDRLEANFSAEL